MAGYRALIIDDEPDIRELLDITLNRMDISCKCAEDLTTAKKILKNNSFDLCLTDMRLPDGDGIEFVSYAQSHYPKMPIAVITAHGNMESAVNALKSGAFDFVTKPVDLTLLRTLVNSALKLTDTSTYSSRDLIGNSSIVQEIRKTISRLAKSQAPVYISGESGVGKELVASMIHEQGPRGSQPFIPVNCGAIPDELMESEFFGHRKGSFTGAHADKQGLFQAAEGGTLFLDEIAELPQFMQVKLLRVIQEKKIRPIGDQQEQPVDVRILCATHKDLGSLVKEGKFRQDLFYRINVIEIHVPTLRERSEDIPLLVDHILIDLADNAGENRNYSLTDAAVSKLMNYQFPGNVRELENILERAMTFCDSSEITEEDLKLEEKSSAIDINNPDLPINLDSYLENIERNLILDSLEKTGWNITAAAKLLGTSFRSLRYRIEKLDIQK